MIGLQATGYGRRQEVRLTLELIVLHEERA